MINRIVDLSEKLANKKKEDPELLERMEVAAKGQCPRFLLISRIDRSSQDLQLLDMRMGDAFHATRVPGYALPPPEDSRVLFSGPASYNCGFQDKRGVIVTFDSDDSPEIVRDSLLSLSRHPDLAGLPIIALHVDYSNGTARLEPHGFGRDYEGENWILSRLRKPDPVDEDYLVLICSDSRVHPPATPEGVPMAIQTLGGYVPPFESSNVESRQLNGFFESWLQNGKTQHRILIVMHGSFRGHGPPCGAAHASLNPSQVSNNQLRPLIQMLREEALRFEDCPSENAEDRVVALASAIKANLLSYPSIQACGDKDTLIEVAFMNTLTNVVATIRD